MKNLTIKIDAQYTQEEINEARISIERTAGECFYEGITDISEQEEMIIAFLRQGGFND